MTKYLVVHGGPRVGITIEPPGVRFTHPFECWAIRSGRQVEFAYTKLHRILDRYHLGGSYDSFARYAFEYDELCALVAAHMGPSDDDRLQAALDESRRLAAYRPSRVDLWPLASLAPTALGAAVRIFGYALKFLVIMLVTPFVLSRFGRRDKW
jgi:hypothetical protein